MIVLLCVVISLFDFRESVYCRRGSWDFWSGINDPVIKCFPILQAVSEPEYHWSCGDGPKLPSQAVSYRSNLPAIELLKSVQPYIAYHGFSPVVNENSDGFAFIKDRNTFYLNIKPAGDGCTILSAEAHYDSY